MGNFYMEATQINYRRDEKLKTVDQKLQELSETSAIDTDIAPVFKSTNTYQPGDMVYYRNKLYVFNVEHTGAWAAADVTATDVTTELSSLKSGLTNVQDDVKLNTQDLTTPSRTANIAISTSSDSTDVSQYSVALYVDCDLKPNTTYTLSFDGTNGARYYTNENLFASQSAVTVGSDRAVLTVTTKSTISKAGNTYTSGKGWIILKNSITEPTGHAFTDVQFEIGSSATPYSTYTPSVETRLEAVETTKHGTITFNTNVTEDSTSDHSYISKCGNVVTVFANLKVLDTVTAWSTTICTLPEGYRPYMNIFPMARMGNTYKQVRISTDGVILSSENMSANDYFVCSFTFVTN